MATLLINGGCEAGVIAGLLSGRSQSGTTTGSYASIVAIAAAITTEFDTINDTPGTLGASMADADCGGAMGQIVQGVAHGLMSERPALVSGGVQSSTATDYVAVATQIYLIAAEIKAVGVPA